jgi:hypothetical protein
LIFERILLLISPYGATSIESLPAVQAHIILRQDEDLSRDIPGIGISRGFAGILPLTPGISALLHDRRCHLTRPRPLAEPTPLLREGGSQ